MVSARTATRNTTRARASATSSGSTKKRKADEYVDSDALDEDEAVEEAEDQDTKPKQRAAKPRAGSAARKKLKVSPSGNEEEEFGEEEPKARRKTANSRKALASKVYDSDAIDDDADDYDDQDEKARKPKSKKRGSRTKASPRKKKVKADEEDEEDYSDDGEYLKDGQMVVGKVVQAPTTGRVPPGQISKNTLDFLMHLKDPKCNDREWFRLHEPVYRVAEKEWKDFVEAFTDVLVEVDPQVPHLPPKDLIHRIYRDVRFSNDKTPYKRGFSATLSRSGRKGIFAMYHINVKPGNESMIAAGVWCPGKNELANIRTNLQRDSRRLWRVISAPKFVEFFGKPERHPKGHRQSIFGHEDELKVAPKGVAKDHKDIDLLKCRTFAVVHRFTDSEVLEPDFKEKLGEVAKIMRPFVYTLNDLVTVGGGGTARGDDEDEEEDGAGGEEAEGDGDEDEEQSG